MKAVIRKNAAQIIAEMPDAPFDGDCLDFLRTIFRGPRQPASLRCDAAKACRYEHPTLAMGAAVVNVTTPQIVLIDDRRPAIELFLAGFARGQIAAEPAKVIEAESADAEAWPFPETFQSAKN